ncbi:MAG: cytochrome c family protein [Desulfobacterales bacterium]
MFKKIIMAIVAIVFVFGSVGISIAAEEVGNSRKGKYTYRKVYQSCNERGEVSSAKPILNPDAKTQAQWKKVFETKDFAEFKCKKEWEALTAKELLDVFTYLHDFAADSPTPAKCK